MDNLYKVKYTWFEDHEEKEITEKVLIIAESYSNALSKITAMIQEIYLDSVTIDCIDYQHNMIYYTDDIEEKLLEANIF